MSIVALIWYGIVSFCILHCSSFNFHNSLFRAISAANAAAKAANLAAEAAERAKIAIEAGDAQVSNKSESDIDYFF